MVTFFIMPVFALANAGVRLEGMDPSMLLGPVAWVLPAVCSLAS